MRKSAPATRRPKLVTTKFRPPLGTGHSVARPRLLAQLRTGAKTKLTLVHGPAGFGKTTLVMQWREELLATGARVAWLSLDREDDDHERCLSYVVEAIRAVEPSIGADLLEVLEEGSDGAVGFVLADLVSEFENYVGEFYLVLDDWHLIRQPTVQESMEFLILHGPPNFHLIITSRSQPQLPLARLRVQGQLSEIGESDLRFDELESGAFLTDASGLDLRSDQVWALWRSTEGWIAALQLALLSLRTSADRDEMIDRFSGKHHSISEYLAENVLNNLPADTLEFLLKTSILERLSGRLCSAVSGRPDGQVFLENLERQDLFIRSLDDERNWFRYHHLFASYLRRRLERDYSEQVASLHRAAAAWFAEQGQTGEAITHALAAGDTERAIELVEKEAMWLVEHSYMATLLGWVNRLPRAALHNRPALQLAIAWANCLMHRSADARVALACVDGAVLNTGLPEAPELLAEASVVKACIDIYEDRIEGVEALLSPCLDCSESFRPWIIAVGANVLTYVHIHSFRFEEALSLQVWARRFHERTQGPFSGVYGLCFSGMASFAMGRLDAAADSFQTALKVAREATGRHSHAARLAGALLGQVLYESGAWGDAELLLEESRELGAEGGVADFSIATYCTYARLKVQQGNFDGAHAILDEGARNAEQLGIERLATAIYCERVCVLLAQGNLTAASRLVESNDAKEHENDAPMPNGIRTQIHEARQLARVRLLCAQGRGDAAIGILVSLIETMMACGRKYDVVGLRVQLALALDLDEQREEAEAVLLDVAVEGKLCGVVRTFLDEGPRLLSLLARAREAFRRGSLVKEYPSELGTWLDTVLSVARGGRCEPPPGATERIQQMLGLGTSTSLALLEPLKEREVEILRMLDQGRANKEIARALGIGVDTVKWYLKSIFAKLGVARRANAISEARRLRILQ